MAAPPPGEPAARQAPPGGESVGSWYAWWPGDCLPALPALPGLSAGPAGDDAALGALAGRDADGLAALRQAGHRPYLARLAGAPVACGWLAERQVEIGEIGLTFDLPAGERYLWGFVTAARWRGRGIYSYLLQAIMRHAGTEALRYWIGHEPGHHASARGILKAGFQQVGEVYRLPAGRLMLVPTGPRDRARVGAALLRADLAADNDARETPPA